MQNNTTIPREIVDAHLEKNGITSLNKASIRQIVKLVKDIENETNTQFVKMEMGVPGLPAAEIGVKAEIEALQNGVASIYPMIDGLPALKIEMARFVKLFLNTDVSPESCMPTVGSMQGAFAAFLTAGRRDSNKKKVLFIDPGFPVQKQQLKVLGIPFESFDVYDFRGHALQLKLEEICADGSISTIIYSNPNNPSWICFNAHELQIIANVAKMHDIVVVEDLAYFGMDFRTDYAIPGHAPFQPSITEYYDNYILLISSSKVFSYAGQRISSLIVSDTLFKRDFKDLEQYFGLTNFGKSLIYGALYSLSSGTSHSSQYALLALLKAANQGTYTFLTDVKEYGNRAERMKFLFVSHGFQLVYDKDLEDEIADGFYFTISYPGFSGAQLAKELLYYGISAITLDITGSNRQGLRACTSQILPHHFDLLQERLVLFNANNS